MGHHYDLVWGPSLPAGGCVEKQTPGLHWPRRQVFSPSGLLSFLCKEKTNDGCTCTVNRHISLSTSCNVRLHKGWWTAARLICYLYSLDSARIMEMGRLQFIVCYMYLYLLISVNISCSFPYRLLHGAVSEGAIDGPRGDEGRLNKGRGSSNRRGGDSHTGDSQQASCLESLIVSMHLLIVALI